MRIGTRVPARFAIKQRGNSMIRRTMFALLCAVAASVIFSVTNVQAQEAFDRQWGRTYNTQDWNRMYHYPYVYYPQNYWGPDYYRSSEDMYHRYPQEMRTPVYNKQWESFYAEHRKDPAGSENHFFPMCNGERHTGIRWYSGHHFNADVF
jgi:hypothetical protein